ncbi:DEAD/DEAH box helicase [Rugamonas rubra]|uniref:DEAD-box ATP-dependent RNA helicase RhpA n=1 Tax=Rugamonas rubra TaxID=758825 RepID=A0A1I4S9A3_9BURK|nr:DEAD/DEAH box helicase [Rugamonas rubra]SFM60870.1 Superfamily II DNA and RNA helicase [Rugamonas rubra]
MSFHTLGLIDPIQRTLDALGYTEPTPVQAQAIPAVLAGRDLMAAAQTGTGKTAGFALPILQRLTMDGVVAPQSVRCLVLVPTRELAEQVYDSFRRYGASLPLRSYVAYGGVAIEPQISKLRKGLDVLVATPGRLLDLYGQGVLNFDSLQTLVLDEADRMLDLGFSRELNAVFDALPKQRQTLLFSATFSDAIRALAGGLLNNPVQIQVSPRNTATKTVKQWLIPTDKKRKPELFLHLLKQRRWGQVLVFVKTRKGVDALVKILLEQGVAADAIHGDKTQPARLRALDRFKTAQVQVLVATDVAARGLDIDALPQVVNFDLPTVAEDYIHRIGRTGRAGAEGEAVSLVCADEVDLLAEIEKLTRQVIRREEEPGFEADHRVPATGPAGAAAAVAATAAKEATTKKKRAFTGPPGGKAAPSGGKAMPSAGKSTLSGGHPGQSSATPVAGLGAPAAKSGKFGGGAGAGGGAARRGGQAAGAPVPKGAVFVTAGRGAKSTARAAAQPAARKAAKPGGRGR